MIGQSKHVLGRFTISRRYRFAGRSAAVVMDVAVVGIPAMAI